MRVLRIELRRLETVMVKQNNRWVQLGTTDSVAETQEPQSQSLSESSKKVRNPRKSASTKLTEANGFGRYDHQCEECQRRFKRKCHLARHMKAHREKLSTCNYCGLQLSSSTSMRQHTRIHTGEKPFMCTLCNKSFSLEGNFDRHKQIHLDVGDRIIHECSLCPKKFMSQNGLTAHVRAHHSQGLHPLPHACTYCPKTFPSAPQLCSHVRTHTGEKPYSCSMCNLKFTHSGNRNRHIAYIHNEERPHPCPKCDKHFKRASGLKTHLETHIEPSERPIFSCQMCSKECRTKTNFSKHMASHTNKDKYACPYCKRKFYLKMMFRNHLLLHTKEKPHVCTQCNKRFMLRSNLGVHVKYFHDGISKRALARASAIRFDCTFCEKKFLTNSERNVHLRRVHTKEKPYACPTCPKAFFVASELRSHVSRCHPEDPSG